MLDLGGTKTFTVKAINFSPENKYIQSATLHGNTWNKAWFHYMDLEKGGTLVLKMGVVPNYDWGGAPKDAPPSFGKE